MSDYLQSFKDILTERRKEYSNFMWISRHLDPKTAFERLIKPSPRFHKKEVLKSIKIQDIIDKISRETGLLKEQLYKDVWTILNEIGFNKSLTIIRWLGLILTKICLQVYSGIYVNEVKLLRIKELMGNKPIIFLPTHRSYADFILMSFLCFTYNIEIPSIAAGMDFYSMWIMGSILRDTGAFFMRRSFNDDNLYWDTFRQYIHQIITEGDLPLEFFIEGTRSRSAKSLFPKLGLLSMVLKTFYTAVVPDILFIPINISYDRVLEEKLFAYELLGVPKPKESTSGFFRSLSIIKEHYGNIYIDFGEPISARNFLGNFLDRSYHNIKPIYMQDITEQEKQLTLKLANEVITSQQKCGVVTTFNLIAIMLLNNFMVGQKEMKLKDLILEIKWINNYLKYFGACTELTLNIELDIEHALKVHKGLVKISKNQTVELVHQVIALDNIDFSKLKGHSLSQETMNYVLPFVTLQLYINPALHYLANSAMIVVILQNYGNIGLDDLLICYKFLQTLFLHEFVSNANGDRLECEELLKVLINLGLISYKNVYYYLSNSKLAIFLKNTLTPFLFTYYMVCQILLESNGNVNEQIAVVNVQSRIESMISAKQYFIHPYCLNLDTISNAFCSLMAMGIISKHKIDTNVFLKIDIEQLLNIHSNIEIYLKSEPSIEDLKSTLTISLPSKL